MMTYCAAGQTLKILVLRFWDSNQSRRGLQCIFISLQVWWLSLPFWQLHFSFSLCHRRPGPPLLNLPLCPLLQTSAVSNLALWPVSPLPIYLHISPIASAPLSFPSFLGSLPALSIFSCCSPPYQLPSLPFFSLVFFNLFRYPFFSLHITSQLSILLPKSRQKLLIRFWLNLVEN